MPEHYFERVRAETGGRFWVNNPTSAEMDLALAHGAMGCTTNPGYGGNLVKRAPEEVLPVVRACLSESDDDEVVAELVQRRLVGRICERFAPLYEASEGREGFVSIQGAPERDTDGANIIEAAETAWTIAPNATPKIPATIPGYEAFEYAVRKGSQVIVTEVFSTAQVIETCERYLRVTAETGVRPPFFMSPITGILGDHLKKLAARDGLDVPDAAMEHGRRHRQPRLLRGRGRARVPGDAALRRCPHRARLQRSHRRRHGRDHQLVHRGRAHRARSARGGDRDRPGRPGRHQDVLTEAFPEMRQALDPAALPLEDFEEFGPGPALP